MAKKKKKPRISIGPNPQIMRKGGPMQSKRKLNRRTRKQQDERE